MATSIEAPPPRNYGQETRETLQAQIDLAPQKYAAEAEYAPRYAALNAQIARQLAPELTSIYGQIAPQLAQTEAQTRGISRAADIGDIEKLGPRARAAIQAASPQASALADMLAAQSQSALAAGSRLTPDQARMAQQESRAAYAARGLAGGPSSALDEALRSRLMSAGVEQQRRQQALQGIAAQQGVYGDVFQQVLGRPSQSFSMLPGAFGQSQSMAPGQLFNPESQYAADIYGGNYQGQLAARTASGANQAALLGGGLGAFGSLGGGLFSAAGQAGGFGKLF
jgi:hypothetical protein